MFAAIIVVGLITINYFRGESNLSSGKWKVRKSLFEEVTYKLSAKDECELNSERENLSSRGKDGQKDSMLRKSMACEEFDKRPMELGLREERGDWTTRKGM